MKEFFEYIDGVIALILVVGALVLLVLGIDSEVKTILTTAGGWAFGSGFTRLKLRRK